MVWRVTTFAFMSLQRSARCRCVASNCCPGLVSSHWWGCLTQLSVLVLCEMLCMLHITWCGQKQQGEEDVGFTWWGLISIASGRLDVILYLLGEYLGS
eukprot:340088-Pelagomonas_calceolata.AAC.1